MTFSAVVRRLDDWINPIAVKEMRQSVNGRVIAWTLVAFLMVQLAISAAALLFSEVLGQSYDTGRNVFMGHLAVLLGTCLFYVPLSTAIRFSSERSEQNIDLFFITTLKPVQIIWGKTLAAMILMLLFFSASMPFLTLTYLLRGLDIPSAFILLALDFMVVAGCVQMGILLACMPGKARDRGMRLLIGLGVLAFVFIFVMYGSFGILSSGLGSSIGTWDFWGPALTTVFFALTVIGLLFVLSVTFVTPPSANRTLGIRIYLICIWFASGIVMGIWSYTGGRGDAFRLWGGGMVLMFAANLFVSICERQELGPRVLRTIPKRKVFRVPAFFVYSGAGGGISYSILMIVGTILMTSAFLEMMPSTSRPAFGGSGGHNSFFMATTAFFFHILAYALTALTIKRAFFSRSQRPNIALEIILLVLMTGSVVPLAVGYLLHSGPWHRLPAKWYMGNPFAAFMERDMALDYLPYIATWAAIAFVITLPWLRKQFRNFKPSVPDRINVLEPNDG